MWSDMFYEYEYHPNERYSDDLCWERNGILYYNALGLYLITRSDWYTCPDGGFFNPQGEFVTRTPQVPQDIVDETGFTYDDFMEDRTMEEWLELIQDKGV